MRSARNSLASNLTQKGSFLAYCSYTVRFRYGCPPNLTLLPSSILSSHQDSALQLIQLNYSLEIPAAVAVKYGSNSFEDSFKDLAGIGITSWGNLFLIQE